MGPAGAHTRVHTLFLTFKHVPTYKDTLKPSIPLQEGTCSIWEHRFACMGLSNTYLSLRHDIEVVAVKGERHISQDRAAVLDDRYRLILDTTVRRPVDTNLRNTEHKQVNDCYLYQYDSRNGETGRVIDRNDRHGSNNICKTIYHYHTIWRFRKVEILHEVCLDNKV